MLKRSKLTNKKGGALSVRTQSKKKDAKGMKKMGTYFEKKVNRISLLNKLGNINLIQSRYVILKLEKRILQSAL